MFAYRGKQFRLHVGSAVLMLFQFHLYRKHPCDICSPRFRTLTSGFRVLKRFEEKRKFRADDIFIIREC